MNKRKL